MCGRSAGRSEVGLLVALLLVLAVVFAALAAFGVPAGRVSLGWLAVACLSLAFAVPQVAAVT